MAGLVSVAVLGPLALAGSAAVERTTEAARDAGQIFQPWQVWWPLGESGHVVVGSYGVKPGYRTAPEWLSPLAHPAIPLVAAALSLLWWWRRRGAAWPEPLLLLAFLLLVRCLLDPWNVSYYHLPFLLALLAWEVQARRAPPLLSTAATLATWASFAVGPRLLEPDAQSLAYLAWAIPLAGALGLRTFSPGAWGRLAAPAAAVLRARLPTLARAALPQPTFRSSLG
jgi:hypothetical protein